MKLALKIDVDTFRGTREGVPNLMNILSKHQAGATFLFSLGPDHTGRAIKRVFRPGFFKKVSRTSVLKHYGLKTLLYGTLLPGPDIGKRCAAIMRSVKEAGFETGIHTYDHTKWQDEVSKQDAAWTATQMQSAVDRYQEIFGEAPKTHGAAGWQMSLFAYRLTQRLGFDYCSDTRGTYPFVPVYNGEIILCPQIPTTLPTLDELIGVNDIHVDNVAEHLLNLTKNSKLNLHVFTLHAELEGGKFSPVFEKLLRGWHEQGYDLVSLQEIYQTLDIKKLPRHEVVAEAVPGRSGTLALQGAEFLAEYA
jgi:peptidoglycan/xylan/chitin deacetylase (PgdA/CDA1 family)